MTRCSSHSEVKTKAVNGGWSWVALIDGNKVGSGFTFASERNAVEQGEDCIKAHQYDNLVDDIVCPFCGSQYGWNGQMCSDCGNVKESKMAWKTAKYILEDTYGAPQAGVDTIEFDEWYELEEYLDENPDVMERIENEYATIYEASRKTADDAFYGPYLVDTYAGTQEAWIQDEGGVFTWFVDAGDGSLSAFDEKGQPTLEDAKADLEAHFTIVGGKKCPECGEEPCACAKEAATEDWRINGDEASRKFYDPIYADDDYAYAYADGSWEIVTKGGMTLVEDDGCGDLDGAIAACDEHIDMWVNASKTADFGDWQDGDWIEQRDGHFVKEWADGCFATVDELTEYDGSTFYFWSVSTFDGSPLLGNDACDTKEEAMAAAEQAHDEKGYINQERYDHFMSMTGLRKTADYVDWRGQYDDQGDYCQVGASNISGDVVKVKLSDDGNEWDVYIAGTLVGKIDFSDEDGWNWPEVKNVVEDWVREWESSPNYLASRKVANIMMIEDYLNQYCAEVKVTPEEYYVLLDFALWCKDLRSAARKADRGDKLQALLNEYCAEFNLMGTDEEGHVADFLDWLYMTGRKANKTAGILDDLRNALAEYGRDESVDTHEIMAISFFFDWLQDNGKFGKRGSRKVAYDTDSLLFDARTYIEWCSEIGFPVSSEVKGELYDFCRWLGGEREQMEKQHQGLYARKSAGAVFDGIDRLDIEVCRETSVTGEDVALFININCFTTDLTARIVVDGRNWHSTSKVDLIELDKLFTDIINMGSEAAAEKWRNASRKFATKSDEYAEPYAVYELDVANGTDTIYVLQNEFGEWGWQWVDGSDGESVIDQDFDYGSVEPVIEYVEDGIGAVKVAAADDDFDEIVDNALAYVEGEIEDPYYGVPLNHDDILSEIYVGIDSCADILNVPLSDEERDDMYDIIVNELEGEGLL